MRAPMRWIGVATVAGLAGCVAQAPHPLDLPAGREALTKASLDDGITIQALNRCGLAAPAAGHAWTKAELTCAALARSPRMHIARSAVEEAWAGLTTAAARANPTLSLSADRAAGVPVFPWLWGFTVDVPLDGGARRALRMASADIALRAARLDYAEQGWALRRELHAAVRSMLIAQRRVEVAERMSAAAGDWLAAVEARIDAGEAAAAERVAPRSALARASSERSQSRLRSVESCARAAVALGLLPPALANLDWQEAWMKPQARTADLDFLRSDALAHRADLARALRDYDASELDLQREARNQYPQISIGPGYTYDHGTRKLTFAVNATLPLFNRNEGPIAQARVRRQAAERRVDAVQVAIAVELDAAAMGWAAAEEALAAAQEQRAAADRAVDRLRRARDAGAEDRAALRAGEVDALDGRLAEIAALETVLNAQATLEDALRVPLDAAERAFARTAAYREDHSDE